MSDISWLPGATVDHLYLDENKRRPFCRYKPLPPKNKDLNNKKCKRCYKYENKIRNRIDRLKNEKAYEAQVRRDVNRRKQYIERKIERYEKKLENLDDEIELRMERRQEELREARRHLLELHVK